jgi:hypothetical protein
MQLLVKGDNMKSKIASIKSNIDEVCDEYGLGCMKCPLWNKYCNFCTKYKIYSTMSDEHLGRKRLDVD